MPELEAIRIVKESHTKTVELLVKHTQTVCDELHRIAEERDRLHQENAGLKSKLEKLTQLQTAFHQFLKDTGVQTAAATEGDQAKRGEKRGHAGAEDAKGDGTDTGGKPKRANTGESVGGTTYSRTTQTPNQDDGRKSQRQTGESVGGSTYSRTTQTPNQDDGRKSQRQARTRTSNAGYQGGEETEDDEDASFKAPQRKTPVTETGALEHMKTMLRKNVQCLYGKVLSFFDKNPARILTEEELKAVLPNSNPSTFLDWPLEVEMNDNGTYRRLPKSKVLERHQDGGQKTYTLHPIMIQQGILDYYREEKAKLGWSNTPL